jgi:CO/xanthine dehydrogenase Mo-binding subunit
MTGLQPFDRGDGYGQRGPGLAIAIKAVISPTTSVAIVNVSEGGTTLYCGTVDMGPGSDTAMAQMVGEILNVSGSSERGAARHRRHALRRWAALGSRSLFHGARGAPRRQEARDKIAAMARDLGCRTAPTIRSPTCSEEIHAGQRHRQHHAPTSPTTFRPNRAPGSPPT